MCGIAGIWHRNGNPVQTDNIKGMLSHLVYRGPDAEGIWSVPGVVLGHRRLKILDLSDAANQPFTDGNDVLVFNGEIFNYISLREALSSRFPFTTRSDTEVLFRALQLWGEKALDKIRGQFAFAFYKASDRSLMLARDHAGICPLYTMDTGDAFYFSSEIKPLLSVSPRSLDPQGVMDYFKYRYNIQNGHTLFEGIRRFHPAHYMIIDLASDQITEKRYWRLRFDEQRRSAAEAQSEFNRIFDDEVSAQKMGDVPIGLYLSGGIDSGALVSGFAKTTTEIRSFTLSFSKEDPDFSRVQELSKLYSFQTNLLEFSPDEFDHIEDVVSTLEEPFGDLIISANYLLAKKAGASVKVVLSGEGGDEAFCGYDHQRAFMKLFGLGNNNMTSFLAATALKLPSQIVSLLKTYPGKFGNDELSRMRSVFRKISDPADAYLELVSLFNDQELQKMFSPRFKSNFPGQPDTQPIREIFKEETETWKAVMRAEIEQLTLIVNLLKQDRFAMNFSLEGRVPLVSKSVMEFAATLPYKEMFSSRNKGLLLGYSGNGDIKKRPFSLFSGKFYLETLIRLMERYVTEEAVNESGVLSWQGVQALRIKASQGGMLAVKQAMAVLVFIIWWKVFRKKGWVSSNNA